MNDYQVIQDFISLAIETGAAEAADRIYLLNQLLHFLGLSTWEQPTKEVEEKNSLILMEKLMTIAREHQAFEETEEEFYEAALMNFITPLPRRINKDFWVQYAISPEQATNYFYGLARKVNQVKTREIAQNIKFIHPSKYGDIEITINLSKPEKDPKKIASAKLNESLTYPACALCLENEGYYGIGNRPARSNHRIIRLKLNGENWGFQYSPYAYYNEHSIVLNEKHQPMRIDAQAFSNLFSFLDIFPHYMIGSNADLPIVGGSILTHDHYQAGCHEFPMAKAALREKIVLGDFSTISAGIVDWPMSVLRLASPDKTELIAASKVVLGKWQQYSDEALNIVAVDEDKVLHHTITPIARKRGNHYEIDLVLRDNNVSKTFPDGIFHPHANLHHIKRENIGLIEVMGLAILPPRLKSELREVEKYLLDQPNQIRDIHLPWATELKKNDSFTPENVEEKVRHDVGDVFVQVLQDAGVFKDDKIGHEGFERFIRFINGEK